MKKEEDLSKLDSELLRRRMDINSRYIGQYFSAGGCQCFMPGIGGVERDNERIQAELLRRSQQK
jgi:hypothetical protein